MVTADLPDVTLCYSDDGVGPPLVMHHGSCCDSHDWDSLIASLPPGYRTIAYDARGHGRSRGGEITVPALAQDFVGLVQRLELAPVYAIGHSMGAAVLSTVAVERPDLIRGLVSITPGYGLPLAVADWFAARRERFADPAQAVDAFLEVGAIAFTSSTPAHVATRVRRLIQMSGPDLVRDCCAAQSEEPHGIWVQTEAAAAYLRRRACPVLAIHTDDKLADWERATFQNPHSRTITHDGSGHWVHIERAHEIAQSIDRWVVASEGDGAPPTP